MTTVEILTPGVGAWTRLITASKIPGLFNASKYSSPVKEFHLLRGEIDPDGTNDAIERGQDFEPIIIARFFRRHPELERLPSASISRPGLESWAAATPDAIARHRETGEVFTVEAKTDGRGDYQWGPNGSAEIPMGYYLQKQWQLHHRGVRRGYVICLGPFYVETEHIITYDAGLASDVVEFAYKFWRNAMDPDGVPPDVDGHIETYNAIRRAHPEIDRGQHEDWPVSFDLAREFEAAVAGLDAAEERLNLARSSLLRVMGRARRAIVGHGKNKQVVATRQPTKNGAAALYKFRKPIDWTAAALPPVEEPAKS
ncbi:YqaJ viral recombinase family protein [Nocardia bovistercoris]|uniref:YqaJ viral recombinase family protein n=1 Tax=Nocardia bovistercoris TaxID=2785916 RepID=A0A931N4E2_9NOCA|nr:YqaJ viral recombinase family protein [Nocardia bovistercoris]